MKKQLFCVFYLCMLLMLLLGAFLFRGVPLFAQEQEIKTMNEFFGINIAVGSGDNPDDIPAFAGWVRDYASWDWFEPQNNTYTFTDVTSHEMFDCIYPNMDHENFDALYTHLKELGIKTLMLLLNSPEWISSNPDHLDYIGFAPSGDTDGSSPQDYKEAAEFYYQLAARYGSKKHDDSELLTPDKKSGLDLVSAIEVFNEADGEASWGKHITTEQYAAMLNAIYDGDEGRLGDGYGIKAADPDLPVSITGLGKRLESLKKITEACGRVAYDIINIHYYSFMTDPKRGWRIQTRPEWGGLEEKMKEIVEWRDQNAPGVPIWMTELGWDTKPYNTEAVTEQEAADYLIRGYLIVLGAGVDKCSWFYFRDIDDERQGIYTSCGLFENRTKPNPDPPPQLIPKLTYWYFATMKTLLGEMVYVDNLSGQDDPTVYHYRFKSLDGSKETSVLWYCPVYKKIFRTPPPETIEYLFSLPSGVAGVRAVRPVGGSVEGEEVALAEEEEGRIKLTLSATPIFLEVSYPKPQG